MVVRSKLKLDGGFLKCCQLHHSRPLLVAPACLVRGHRPLAPSSTHALSIHLHPKISIRHRSSHPNRHTQTHRHTIFHQNSTHRSLPRANRFTMEGFSLEIPCQAKVCEAFARGECRFGENCSMLHPPEVSPQCQPEIDYKFSRETGEACTRCVQTGLPVRISFLQPLAVSMLTAF